MATAPVQAQTATETLLHHFASLPQGAYPEAGVVLVDDLKLASPKTRDFIGVMSTLDLAGTTLIVAPTEKNLTLASRNIENVTLATSDSLNTYDVLRPDKLLFTKSAFDKVEDFPVG